MVLNEPTAGDMEEALSKMPQDLSGAIQETLDRIDKQPNGRRRLAMATLMWISHALRPLKVDELMEALSIRSGQTSVNRKYFPSPKLMLDCCLGLVTIDEESSTIRLVHFAVEEYFRSRKDEIFHGRTTEIAEACLTYLSFRAFGSSLCDDESQICSFISQYSFLEYAASYWGVHVRTSQSEKIENIAFEFMCSTTLPAFAQQIKKYSEGYVRKYWEKKEVTTRTALHTASRFGLEGIVRRLLELKAHPVDVASHIGTTPLMEAASEGHISIMQALLSANADPYKENWYGTSLHAAAERGNCDSITELLNVGMDVDVTDSLGRTALKCAVGMDRSSAALLLLDSGAHLCYTPLNHGYYKIISFLIRSGRQATVRKLLLQKCDANAESSSEEASVLHWAVTEVDFPVIRFLISCGANVNARNSKGETPLHKAAICSRVEIIRLLVEQGAEVDAQNEDGQTPLFYAVAFQFTSSANVLLKSGASLDLVRPLQEPDQVADGH